MDTENKQQILLAVNALITAPDAHDSFDALKAIIPIATRHPVRLTDGAAVLNPLLDLRLQDKAAYDRVIELVDARRAAMGYDALAPTQFIGYDKTRYMRDFMESKRVRQRVAAEIENLLRPERDRLVGNHRLEFMRQQSMKWKTMLDEAIERAKQNGPLTKEQLRQIRSRFWDGVDEALEQRREAARLEALKPPTQRGGVPEPSLQSIIDAIVDDPYKK